MEQYKEKDSFENTYKKSNGIYFSTREETKGKNDLFLNILNPNVKKLFNRYSQEQNTKYENSKFIYNNSLNKNKSDTNNDNLEFDSTFSKNDENNDIEKKYTRINTYLKNNKLYKTRNQRNKEIEEDKSMYYHSISLPKINQVYKKYKTPNKKHIFNRKKKKKETTNNKDSISSNTESNFLVEKSTFENDIYDSLNEKIKTRNPKYYNKKLFKVLGTSYNFEYNGDNSKYIDLLTIYDIKELETKMNSKRFSKYTNHQYNKRKNDNNNSYNKKSSNNKSKNKNNKKKSKNNLLKLIKDDTTNKSYDCITFKKKIGMNKKRKIRQDHKAKTTNKNLQRLKLNDEGTPIIKENDKGGKIDFKPYYRFNNNYIEKVVLIQKAIRKFLIKINLGKIYKKRIDLKLIHKNNSNNNNDIGDNKTEVYYDIDKNKNINEEYVILIQRMFRKYLNNKINKEKNLKNVINYITKDICEITKIRIKPIKKAINNKNIRNSNISTIKIDNIDKNNVNNEENGDKNQEGNKLNISKNIPLGKKYYYTRSKLALTRFNKILISQDTVKYETDRYTFLKKCYFKNRVQGEEVNDFFKKHTTEFMRKFNLKIRGRCLTPDRKLNIHFNPLLQIDKLNEEGNIQFLSKRIDKNDKSFHSERNKDEYYDNLRENKNNDNTKNNYRRIDEIKNDKDEEKKIGNSSKKNDDINHIKINKLFEEIDIPAQNLIKCVMDEIVINKNKYNNILKFSYPY